MIYIELIFNLSLLVALSIVSSFIEKHRPRHTRSGALLQGILFGGVAVLGMLHPLNLGPGLIFDGRSVMVSLCAFFFGPWAAGVSSMMAIVTRVWIGGTGIFTGSLVILTTSAIGLIAHFRFKSAVEPPSPLKLYIFGIVVHLAMLASMLTLPGNIALSVIHRIGLPVILLFPLATVLAGKILSDQFTAKKRVEALRESEEKYHHLFELESDAIFLIEKDSGKILEANKSASDIYGFSREELLRMKNVDLSVEADKTKQATQDQLTLIPIRYHRKKDGTVFPVEITASHLNWRGREAHIAAIRDITFRIEAESMLRESEERFRRLYEQAPLGYQSLDADGCFVTINQAWLDLMGYSREQVIGRWFGDFLVPHEVDAFKNRFPRFIATGETHVDVQMVQHTGSAIIVHIDGRIGYDERGRFKQTHCILNNITERKRAEEEREKLQAQLYNALEMAHLGHWEYDVANDLFTFNDQFYKIFRTTANQVGGYTMSSAEYSRRFVYPDDMAVVGAETRKAIESTDPHFSRQLEHRIIYADGTIGHISVRFFILKGARGKTVKTYGVNQDITERKRLEEEFLKARKLESVGVLAGGIAHDFNNILTTIIGNISLAKDQMAPEDKNFDLLNEAVMASTRARTLTKQLLTFAKGGAPVKETASIEDILKESTSFVLRGSQSKCTFSIADDLWPAEMDPGQISQVINNIVINANQAMPKGGIIRVAAENLIIEDGHGLPVKPGRYIRISIADQGMGIAEDHILNIFDPYFTTKQEGSGLGLAMTYSIIKKHDGYITVESQLGIGTTFHIYLPASEKAVPKKKENKIIKGRGRILVMDDEAPLRKMVGKMLGNLGYESEFAKDGAEAIHMVKEAHEAGKPYDAVILDLTIPGGMGGKEAIGKLLEVDPEVKAIVSSGYSDDPVLANFQKYGFKGAMPKPFESQSMGKVLHKVLMGNIDC